MKLQPEAIALVKNAEGLYLKSYQCPAGVWTCGYGATGPDIGPGMTWTRKQAEDRLASDLNEFSDGVERLLTAQTSDAQFGAMVSLAFNIGINGFKGSTVLRKHNAGDHAGAAAAFGLWNKGGGRVLPGLVKRRAAEAALYLDGSEIADEPMAQSVKPSSPVKPVAESRSIKAAQVSGALAAAVPAASAALDQADQVKALFGRTEGLLPIAPWFAAAVLAAGLAYMVWRRIDDTRKAEQG